jgi:hypothetical protein
MGSKGAAQINLMYLNKASFKGVLIKDVCHDWLNSDVQSTMSLIMLTRKQFFERNDVATDAKGKVLIDTLEDDIQKILDEDIFDNDDDL